MKLFQERKLSSLFWMPLVQVILVICLSAVLVLFGIYKNTSLWFDEVWVAGVISDSSCFKDFLVKIIQDHQQPLLFVLEYFIYGIADGNEVIFRLPSIVSVAAGTVALLNLGHKYQKQMGAFPALLAITSYTLLCVGAYSARPYGLLFFLSSSAFYYFTGERTGRNLWMYTLTLLLLSLTHWFGLLLAFCFMAVDLFIVLCVRQKTEGRRQVLWSYLFLAPALIWTYLVIKFGGKSLLSFWVAVPDASTVKGLFRYLCGYVRWYELAFYAGCILAVFMYAAKKERNIRYCSAVILIILMIVPVYVYSRYINPQGSLFSYTYFIAVMPLVLVLISYTLSLIANVPISIDGSEHRIKIAGIDVHSIIYVMLMLLILRNGVSDWKSCYNDPLIVNYYRQSSDMICENSDSVSDNSLIILAGDDVRGGYVSKGFLDFYFKRQNRDIPDNVGWLNGETVQYVRKDGSSSECPVLLDEISADAIVVIQGELPSALEGRYIAGTHCAGGTIYYLK